MDTLCWFCERACGGCSWSDKLEPVAGWNAEKTKILITKGTNIDSFIVKDCPLFILTPRSEKDYKGWKKAREKQEHGNE